MSYFWTANQEIIFFNSIKRLIKQRTHTKYVYRFEDFTWLYKS